VAVNAADAEALVTGCQDARTLIDLAETCLVASEKTKPGEYSQKAVEAAARESAALRQCIERQARKMGDEKQDKK
jgi:hypothetical protein